MASPGQGSPEAAPVPWTWAARPGGPSPTPPRAVSSGPAPHHSGPPLPPEMGERGDQERAPRGPTLCSQHSAPTQTGPGCERRLPASGPQGPGAAPPDQTLSAGSFPDTPPHPRGDRPSAAPGRRDSFQGPGEKPRHGAGSDWGAGRPLLPHGGWQPGSYLPAFSLRPGRVTDGQRAGGRAPPCPPHLAPGQPMP